jgi:hypothetical protein
VGVDFVLDQGGACRCTTPADVALLDHRDIESSVSEMIGDQRSGDSTADDRDIALEVASKRRKRPHQSVLDRPKRVTTLEVHRAIA